MAILRLVSPVDDVKISNKSRYELLLDIFIY